MTCLNIDELFLIHNMIMYGQLFYCGEVTVYVHCLTDLCHVKTAHKNFVVAKSSFSMARVIKSHSTQF